MDEKKCTKCGLLKSKEENFSKNSQSKDGYRLKCKECEKIIREQKQKNNPYEYRLYVMSSTILKRLKYCHYDNYTHWKSYKEKNIKCFLGKTPHEIAKVLDTYFRDDIIKLINEGKTPSVDRIDSDGNYELGNIRILDAVENGLLGYKSANEERKKPIKAIFASGKEIIYESLNEAERELGLNHTCISRLIKREGVSRKDKIRFEFVK